MEMEVIISTENVNKYFGKQPVLTGIDLQVRHGEIFGLLGPSGAGKTTLVKQFAGLDIPSEGINSVMGEKMPSLKVMERIGYMAQSDALYTELTAKENLDFFGALYKMNKATRKKRIPDVLALVNLTAHEHKLVSSYSGGMKRRLSLAATLLHEPELLILDEPTVGIDPVLRKSIWETFNRLKQAGKTIIVTTHVMDEAEKCDRLGMIRNGKLIAVGTPKELIQQTGTANIEEAFLVYGGA